jgi:succinate dehydrogenase hydrophobic anchor subunit
MTFRNYLAGTIFAVLLIWGPIDHSWPAWLAIRIGYVILLPLVVWLLLGWVWNHWQPNNKLEIILERILSGIICITLFVLAALEVTSKIHIGNTQWIQTRDGMEAVGDDIVLQGPDCGNAFVLAGIAILVLWFGVLRKGVKTSGS